MKGFDFITLGVLILLLLPPLTAAFDERKHSNYSFIALALGGIAADTYRFGWMGTLHSVTSSFLCLSLVSALVVLLYRRWRIRLLDGAQIKLFAAGATWLPVYLGVTLSAFSYFTLVVLFLTRKKLINEISRPNIVAIYAALLLSFKVFEIFSNANSII